MVEAIVWFITMVILPAAIAYGISLLLAPKQKDPDAGTQKIQAPTATEGRPFPILFGSRMIRGLNAVNPILYKYSYYEKYHDETAANIYHAGFHIGVCLCLDGIKQIWWDKRVCWPEVNGVDTFADDGEITAVMPYMANWLWGDWAYGGPGGVQGTIDILYGDSDQGLNSYLQTKLGSDHPYYRGFVSMVFREPFYIGTAPVIKPIAVLGKRTDITCERTTMWYLSKASIGTYNDMNPAHIVYELLTSTLIGRGVSKSLIGDSFTDTADTLYSEGFGLSCVWDYAPDDIDSMISQIEKIVDGRLYFDYDTEKFEFGLNRDDYTPANLETFDESDFWIESAGFLSVGRMPSKVIVTWEDRWYEGQRLAYDDDIALLARQAGMPNVQEYNYSGFLVDGDLANTIAARQQYAFSAMPKKFTLHCLRTMSHLHETDVFKINYPDLNITSMIVRVLSVDRGSLASGECIVDCIEDVFGLSYTVYGTPPEPETGETTLESNIAGDSIGIADLVIIVLNWGVIEDDDIAVQDYIDIRISGLIYMDDDIELQDYANLVIS
jgi:hypothetical protein